MTSISLVRWLASGLIACSLSAFSSAQVYVWSNAAGGVWSLGSNWQGGAAPPVGGGSGLTLNFGNGALSPLTASNDLGNPFVLNTLNLTSTGSGLLTITCASSNSFRFAGGSPTLNYFGSEDVVVGNTGGIVLGGSLQFGGTGTGTLKISEPISQSGGVYGLFVNMDPSATLNLSVANSFSGGVTLNSGNLVTGASSGLGTGPLTINGGSVALFSNTPNPIVLNADLRGYVFLLPASSITANNSSAGWFDAAGKLECPATYSGPTQGLGDLVLQGNASFPNSSGFTFRNGRIRLNNNAGNPQRFNPSVPFLLDTGILDIDANFSPTSESVGALAFKRRSSIVFNLGSSGQPATLQAASLTRVAPGGLLVGGRNLGGTPGAQTANINIATPPVLVGGGGAAGSANISLIPGVAAEFNTTSNTPLEQPATFVTYDVNGIRPLNPSTEYATVLTGASTNNVRVASALSTSVDRTMNSLAVATGGSISGTGTLHVTSGQVLNSASNGVVSNPIDFGTVETDIWGASNLTLSGNLVGSGDLVVLGGLTLSGNNTGFTGTLDIYGSLTCTTASSVPGTGTINGSEGSLAFGIDAPLNRNIDVSKGAFTLIGGSATQAGQMDGVISGDGAVTLVGGVGGLRLTAHNTYTGPTTIQGTVLVSSDDQLGPNPQLEFFGTNSTIKLEGNLTTSRLFHAASGAIFNTNGFNATLNGKTMAVFTKKGAGTLTINNLLDGYGIVANEGTCVIHGYTPSTIMDVGTAAGTLGSVEAAGTFWSFSLGANGTISPGGSSVGTLTYQTTSAWTAGGAIDFDLGPTSDRVNIVQALNRTGGAGPRKFNFHGTNIAPGTYTLMTYSSSAIPASDYTFTGPGGLTGFFSTTATELRFTVTAPPQITGTVTLGDFSGTVAGQQVTIEVRNQGSTTPLDTYTTTLDSTGHFAVNTTRTGFYDVAIKGSHWLRKVVPGVFFTGSGASNVNATLTNGDINGDNAVTLGDFAQLRAAFGSSSGDPNWNPNADLNGNLSVTLGDFAILRAHFGESGDN